MVKSGETATFTYNADGLRVKKVCTTTGTTNYTLHGKNVVHLSNGSNNLHFFYDAQNTPAVVVFNGTAYGYVHNLQGDIIAIANSTGTRVVEYSYDPWGKPLSKTGTLASTLGTLNPFRYRGYIYDEETGLYYLRSRFYSLICHRFISIDSRLANLYNAINNVWAYCCNEPILHVDNDGKSRKKMVPTHEDGYISPNSNGEPKWSSADLGWVDAYGNVWLPQTGPRAHGGEHWDVQSKRGKGYINVYPGGKTSGGKEPYPHLPNVHGSDANIIMPTPESFPLPEPLPTLCPMPTLGPLPTPGPYSAPLATQNPVEVYVTAVPFNPIMDVETNDTVMTVAIIGIVALIMKMLAAPLTGGASLALP